MQTSWPVLLLFGLALLSATVLLALLLEHLRPHPEDLTRLNDKLATMDLHVHAIVRARFTAPLHYQRKGWALSRFARFYRIEGEMRGGGKRTVYAAFDPWRPDLGMQIL
jgi:hypothetical protein